MSKCVKRQKGRACVKQPAGAEAVADSAEFKEIAAKFGAKHEHKRSDKCAKCPGYCCRRFWIRLPFKKVRGAYRPDWDKTMEWAKEDTRLKNAVDHVRAMRRWFKQERCLSEKHELRASQFEMRNPALRRFAFSCVKFKNGACSAYHDRPEVCKRFLCETPGTPLAKHFPIQARLFRKDRKEAEHA